MSIFIIEVEVNFFIFGIVKQNITQVQLNTSTIVTGRVFIDLLKDCQKLYIKLKLCAKLNVENIKDIRSSYNFMNVLKSVIPCGILWTYLPSTWVWHPPH